MLDDAERYVEHLGEISEELLYPLSIELAKQGLVLVELAPEKEKTMLPIKPNEVVISIENGGQVIHPETRSNAEYPLPNLCVHHIEGTRAFWELLIHNGKNYEWIDKEFAPYGTDLPAERYAEVLNYAMEIAEGNTSIDFTLNIGYLEPSYAKTHLNQL